MFRKDYMHRPSYHILLIIIPGLIIFLSCRNESTPTEQTGQGASPGSDRSLLKKEDSLKLLAKIYCQAISDFLTNIKASTSSRFDTLYIGKRKFGQEDDFPEIDLPVRINGTKIVLLEVEEANTTYRSKYTEHSPYINLLGWINKEAAEFMFVCFYPEFSHQMDVRIQYSAEPAETQYATSGYKLSTYRIETMHRNRSGEASFVEIIENGKPLGRKKVLKTE